MDERVREVLPAGCKLREKDNPNLGDPHPAADRVAARHAVYRVPSALPSVVSRVGRRRRTCTRSDSAEGPGLQPGLEKWCTLHARRGFDVGGDALVEQEGPVLVGPVSPATGSAISAVQCHDTASVVEQDDSSRPPWPRQRILDSRFGRVALEEPPGGGERVPDVRDVLRSPVGRPTRALVGMTTTYLRLHPPPRKPNEGWPRARGAGSRRPRSEWAGVRAPTSEAAERPHSARCPSAWPHEQSRVVTAAIIIVAGAVCLPTTAAESARGAGPGGRRRRDGNNRSASIDPTLGIDGAGGAGEAAGMHPFRGSDSRRGQGTVPGVDLFDPNSSTSVCVGVLLYIAFVTLAIMILLWSRPWRKWMAVQRRERRKEKGSGWEGEEEYDAGDVLRKRTAGAAEVGGGGGGWSSAGFGKLSAADSGGVGGGGSSRGAGGGDDGGDDGGHVDGDGRSDVGVRHTRRRNGMGESTPPSGSDPRALVGEPPHITVQQRGAERERGAKGTAEGNARAQRTRAALALISTTSVLGIANLLRSAWVRHGKFGRNLRDHAPTLASMLCAAGLSALALVRESSSEYALRAVLRWYPLLLVVRGVVVHGDSCFVFGERPEVSIDVGTYTTTVGGGVTVLIAVYALLRKTLGEASLLLAFMGVYAVLLWWHHKTTIFGVVHMGEVLAVCGCLFVAYATVSWKHSAQSAEAARAAAHELHRFAAQRRGGGREGGRGGQAEIV